MVWLTRQSLKRPSITILIAVAVIVFGILSIGAVKQEIFPSLAFPIVSVTTVYPGASAEVVDQDVTQPIEQALSGVQGVDSIQSTSSEGFVFTILQFDVNADVLAAKTQVQDKLAALRLPTGVQPPSVGTFDFASLPVLSASVSGDNLSAVQARVENELIPALSAIEGVNQVTLTGGATEKVVITLDPAKLAANNLTQQQVIQFLQGSNLAFPVGTVEDNGRTLPLRVTHLFSSTAEIESIVVGIKGMNATGGSLGGGGLASGQGNPPTSPTPAPALPTEAISPTLIPPALQTAGITTPAQITPQVIAGLPEAGLDQFPVALALVLPDASQAALAARLPAATMDPQLAAAGITTPAQITPELVAQIPAAQLSVFPLNLALALGDPSQAALAQRLATATPPTSASTGEVPAEFAAFGITRPDQITPEVIGQVPAPALSLFTPALVAQLSPASQAALAQRLANPTAAGSGGIPENLLVQLKDVGTVERTTIDANTITRTNGQVSLGLQISKDDSANTVTIVEAVKAEFDRVAATPGTVPLTIKIVQEQATAIEESIAGVARGALIGALVAVIVIFFFLFSLKTTLVAAVSIPLSIVVALILMRLQGYSLNVITLGGLAVAVGRVVDDSIVVLENIYRHLRRGDDPTSSVIDGTKEVAGAITASTLTTVAVFLPLGLAGGLISKLFLPFALTITYALLASLLVALTIVPLLARLFLSRLAGGEERESGMQRIYTATLAWSLHHRGLTLLIAGGLFAASLALMGQLNVAFLPDNPEKNIAVTITTPPGTDLETTTARAVAVEEIANRYKAEGKISEIQTTIGGGGNSALAALSGGSSGGNQAQFSLVLSDQAGDPEVLADQIEAQIGQLPGIESASVQTVDVQQSGGGSSGLDLLIVGKDLTKLREANDLVMARIGANAGNDLGIANVTSNLAAVKPALQVTVDPQKAIQHGSITAQVALQIQGLLNGQRAGMVTLAGDDRPLELFVEIDRSTLDVAGLRALKVGTVNPVALEEIATIEEVPGATSITRIGGDRVASIKGQFTSKDTINAQAQVEAALKTIALPEGVEIRTGTQAASQAEALGDMGTALLIAIVLVYLVMLFAFGSLLTPFVILFSLPLAVIGAVLGLFVTGKPLGITSLIGVLMLIGIVVTNAIVLLELVEQYRKERGMATYDALIRAGRVRLRPILMTALATIVALLPLATGIEKGGFLTADLAVVVIGGLFTSTLLTLLVVPVIYSLADGMKRRFGFGMESRLTAEADGGSDAPSPADG